MQIPGDFASIAPTRRTVELAEIYGKSVYTIRNWCRELGIKAARAPSGRRFGTTDDLRMADSTERVQMCLRCKEKTCNGRCAKILEVI